MEKRSSCLSLPRTPPAWWTRSTGLTTGFRAFLTRGSCKASRSPLTKTTAREKRHRELVFDHVKNTVISTLNEDLPETFAIPDHTQDALSSLYYLRTRDDFIVGKPIIIQVHDSGKNWSVEVHTLGRERVTTPAGTFATIKVRTFPKYEGVFMNKGEIFIWLTDDSRKIPVLMKSTIAIGSIVSTLTKRETGKDIE